MHNFQSFAVTFPEVRQYRLAVWLEMYAALAAAVTSCMFFGFTGSLSTLMAQLWMIFLTGIVMVTSTRYGIKLKRRLLPVLNKKLRDELQSRSGLVIPEGFPAAEECRMLPLRTRDGITVTVSIRRHGDTFVMRREHNSLLRLAAES